MVNTLPIGYKFRNGEYTVEKQLPSGGFSCNYLVRTNSNKPKVIKELFKTNFCQRANDKKTVVVQASNVEDFEKLKTAFRKEANIGNQASHKNIVNADLFFEENNTIYLVFDYIEGNNLELTVHQKTSLQLNLAIGWICQIGEILQTMHDTADTILHLDCTPTNIVIDRSGSAHLIDFGISRPVNDISDNDNRYFTPNYASIDQQRGIINKQNDIYSLGATAYFLLTGSQPIDAKERQIGKDPLFSPSQQNILLPKVFDAFILKAMALKSSDAYDSITEFTNDMRQALHSLPKKGQQKVILTGLSKASSKKSETTLVLSKEVVTESATSPLPAITLWKELAILGSLLAIAVLLFVVNQGKQGVSAEQEIPPISTTDVKNVNLNIPPAKNNNNRIATITDSADENSSANPENEAPKIKKEENPKEIERKKPRETREQKRQKAYLRLKDIYTSIDYSLLDKRYIRVKDNEGRYGVADLDKEGQLIIPCKYSLIEAHFTNVAMVREVGTKKWGIVNGKKEISTISYDKVTFSENRFKLFRENDTTICFNQKGKQLACN